MPKKPDQFILNRASKLVVDTYSDYEKLNAERNAILTEVYKTFVTYQYKREPNNSRKGSQWQMDFLVNKAHEVVERILPRIVSRNPKWIVSPKKQFFEETSLPPIDPANPQSIEVRNKELRDRRERAVDYSMAIQDYLTYLFDEYDFSKRLRLLAKQMIVYGKGRARIGWKYETAKIVKKREEEILTAETEINLQNPEMDEMGNPLPPEIKTESTEVTYVEEQVIGERPTIEIRSFTQILVDPRYKDIQDMPAYIEKIEGVRLGDLFRKKEYFNLDKLQEVCGLDLTAMSMMDYQAKVRSIVGIENVSIESTVDENALIICKYYGYFNEKENPEDEKLYKITFHKDTQLVIGFEEIAKIPFVEADCFEDVETNFCTGFVEPIIGLQKELNFKKNSASDFVNLALNRSFVWSPKSGIDPRDLISRPNGVIVTTKDGQTAMSNLIELPMRSLPSDFFQEQNDIERQIQGQTFTVDTSNPMGQQALTNTATGARIEFFESNVVLDQVRKQFEEALENLAYLLLQETFENLEENVVFKKQGTEDYWDMNKELLRDAVQRYSIKVETGSTSFDSIEARRADTIAFYNMLMGAYQAGVPIDMQKAVVDIIETFEKKSPEDYILPPKIEEVAQNMPGLRGELMGPEAQGEMPDPSIPAGMEGQAQLVQDVAGGNIFN